MNILYFSLLLNNIDKKKKQIVRYMYFVIYLHE